MVSGILMACLLETLQRSRVSRVVYLMLSECAMISRVDVTSHSYQESELNQQTLETWTCLSHVGGFVS